MRKIHLTYFKPSGKYYSEGDYTSEHLHEWMIYDEVLKMEKYPGLVGGWEGFILVQPEDGAPAIVQILVDTNAHEV